MSLTTAVKMYETVRVLDKVAEASTGQAEFYVISGSRMLITLAVQAITADTVVRIYVENTFSVDEPYDLSAEMHLTYVGQLKEAVSGFNSAFRIRYEVVGGTASFKVTVLTSEGLELDSDCGGCFDTEIDGGEADTVYSTCCVIDGGDA